MELFVRMAFYFVSAWLAGQSDVFVWNEATGTLVITLTTGTVTQFALGVAAFLGTFGWSRFAKSAGRPT